jgi:hypothetical protein
VAELAQPFAFLYMFSPFCVKNFDK